MLWIILAIVFVVAAIGLHRFLPSGLVAESNISTTALRAVLVILAVFFVFSTSYVHIEADEVGHLKKVYIGTSLPPGKIIALKI